MEAGRRCPYSLEGRAEGWPRGHFGSWGSAESTIDVLRGSKGDLRSSSHRLLGRSDPGAPARRCRVRPGREGPKRRPEKPATPPCNETAYLGYRRRFRGPERLTSVTDLLKSGCRSNSLRRVCAFAALVIRWS